MFLRNAPADHDENSTDASGGHQYVHNLAEDGKRNSLRCMLLKYFIFTLYHFPAGSEYWNKWYSGVIDPPAPMAATITIQLSCPSKIHRYSLTSAGDCLGRCPKSWELWGKRSKSDSEFELIHGVHTSDFVNVFVKCGQTIDLDINDDRFMSVEFVTVQLRLLKNQGENGYQLSKFILWSLEGISCLGAGPISIF